MNGTENPDASLTDADDSILIIIDVQQVFLDKLEREQSVVLANRISWIASMAERLDIPIVITAEDTDRNNGTVPQITTQLSPGLKEFNKMAYGLAADQNIMRAIEKTSRNTGVLVGLETDVCVCQSALGLLESGYRVVVLGDAVGSPGPCHDFGIERMRNAGAIISSVKGIFYEWQRTICCGDKIFSDVYTTAQPEGIYL